ncbi:MAG: hypothetical protein HW400_780 [Candidatus Levybacteria bacterium]|nr:hypothetical protein [Candidatus Levybacteria bacterium]
MARPNRKQHKIPRTYLEGFTNSKGLVWVADRKFNLYPQKPNNILTESDYYTVRFESGGGTLDIETKFLGGIEASYAEIYRDKIKKKEKISLKIKARLSIFIASMMERQSIKRKSMVKMFADVKEKVRHLEMIPVEKRKNFPVLSSGPSISAHDFLKMGEDVGSLHSSMMPDTVTDIAPIIYSMKWLFISRPSDSYPFITSDNPCILVDPVAEAKFGKGTMGALAGFAYTDTELTLPLSSDLALMCRWEATMDCVYGELGAEMVQEINRRSIRHAEIIIGSDKDMLEKIIRNVKTKQAENIIK